MPPSTEPAPHCTPMTGAQGWIQPETGNKQGEQGQAQPPPAAPHLAGVLRKVTLCVRHAVVKHGPRAPDTRHLVNRAPHAVWRVLARPALVLLLHV